MNGIVSVLLQSSDGQSLLLGFGGVGLGIYILMNTGGVVTIFNNMLGSDVTPAGEVGQHSGVVQLEGSAQPVEGTVESPLTNTECLVYDYNKTRIHERDTDDDQMPDSRRREQLGHDHEAVSFGVEDESGSVTVDPAGANLSVDRDHIEGHKESRDQRISETEHRIDVDETVHVWGQAQADEESNQVYVGDGPDAQFRIGTGDRTEAVAETGFRAFLTLAVGILSLLGGTYVLADFAGLL